MADWIPAAITGASSILGGLFGGKDKSIGFQQAWNEANQYQTEFWNWKSLDASNYWNQAQLDASNSWNQQQLDFANRQFLEQQHQFRNTVQERVADAKAAGLHPLFALGQSGGGSPIQFMPGGSSMGGPSFGSSSPGGVGPTSGSGLGDGIAAAGRALAASMSTKMEKEAHAANLRRINASALRDEMDAARIMSDMKRAEQTALSVRGAGDGVVTYGYDQAPPVPNLRTIEAHPRQDRPETITGRGGSGGRREILNPDLGLDEVAQLRYALEPLVDQFSSVLRYLGLGNFARPSLDKPRSYYHYWKRRGWR